MESERAALVGVVRCLPAWTRRRVDVGAEVRSERRCRSVEIGVEGGWSEG